MSAASTSDEGVSPCAATLWPMGSPNIPDFRTVISQFEELTADWQRKAAELSAAVSASGGTYTCPEFTLRAIAGGQITELIFTDDASSESPVKLRDAVLDALARLTVAGNREQAVAVASILGEPDMATGIRSSVPHDILDRLPDADLDDETSSGQRTGAVAGVHPASAEEVLEWASATVDEQVIVSSDITELMSDVEGWSPDNVGRVDPLMAQYELEKEIAQLSTHAAGLSSALSALSVTKSDKTLGVTVNAAGRLTDLKFTSSFRSAGGAGLTADFARLYAEACHEASTRALEQLDATGLAELDNPSRAIFASVQAASHPEPCEQ